MYKILSFLIFLFTLGNCLAQELNCKVTVNAQRVQQSDTRVFEDMEKNFSQFLNNRKWTSDEFLPQERISCNMLINLEASSNTGSYKATVQVQVARPVYGTDYQSVLLNFADRDWQYTYVESQPLNFVENAYSESITSLLAYYAYVIIGFDYDSFSSMGGSDLFDLSNQVIINAQQSGTPGWSQFEGTRNRYWLTNNLMNPQLRPVREAMYEYHLKGLDIFSTDPVLARKNILESLKKIQAAKSIQNGAILIVAFFDAKTDELVNIFKEADPQTKQQAYELLRIMEPGRTSKFQEIIQN